MSRRVPLTLSISPQTSPSSSQSFHSTPVAKTPGSTSPKGSSPKNLSSPKSLSSPRVVSGDSDIAGYMTLSSLDRSNSRHYASELRHLNSTLSPAEAMKISKREYIAAKKAATVAVRVAEIAKQEVDAVKERLIREGKARSLEMGRVGAAKQQAKEEKLQRSITLGQERLRRAGVK
jgi:hypothetical protein